MYYKEFQFHGYMGIKNPKGMIKFLSQTQDDDDGLDYSDDDEDSEPDTDTQGTSALIPMRRLLNDSMDLSPKSLIRYFLSQESQDD